MTDSLFVADSILFVVAHPESMPDVSVVVSVNYVDLQFTINVDVYHNHNIFCSIN